MTQELILFLTPIVGVSLVVAIVWWQNERDYAARNGKKK